MQAVFGDPPFHSPRYARGAFSLRAAGAPVPQEPPCRRSPRAAGAPVPQEPPVPQQPPSRRGGTARRGQGGSFKNGSPAKTCHPELVEGPLNGAGCGEPLSPATSFFVPRSFRSVAHASIRTCFSRFRSLGQDDKEGKSARWPVLCILPVYLNPYCPKFLKINLYLCIDKA